MIVSDYNGGDFHITNDDIKNKGYLCYTSSNSIKIVSFIQTVPPYAHSNALITLVGSLAVNGASGLNQPRLLVINSILYMFVNVSGLRTTIINRRTNIITLGINMGFVNNYMPFNVEGDIFIVGTTNNNNLFQILVSSKLSSSEIITLKSVELINNSSFDICNINSEQYIFYITNTGKMGQMWNPINSINITYNSLITSISGMADGGILTPNFSNTITDYGIQTNNINNKVSYTLNINGQDITDTAYPQQLITITDSDSNIYYIRLHPSGMVYGDVVTKTPDYVPGYYLTSSTQGESGYYCIHDSNGIPIWWRRANSDPNFLNNPQTCSIQKGNGYNRVITLIFDGFRPRTTVNVETLEEGNYMPIVGSRDNTYFWEVHESLEIKGPGLRSGNIMYQSYTDGFYIQEQTPTHEFVWDWFSTDLVNQTNPEYFHVNSLDVHPVTGDIIVSARSISCVFCINYVTKNIDWAIDPDNYLAPQMYDSSLTTFLNIVGEPIIYDVQYNGTSAQHDARWHPEIAPLTPGNQVISVFDDESFHGRPAARGVIYEIDFINGNCIFRGNCYSSRGTSGYMGSYKVNFEANGTTSHLCDFVQQHPSMVEFAGDSLGMPTQNVVFEMDFPGDRYRCDKATPEEFSIQAMRLTAGMPYSTV
jgi:hypothetical protein